MLFVSILAFCTHLEISISSIASLCLPARVGGAEVRHKTDGWAGVRTGVARSGVGARVAWTGGGGAQKSAWAAGAHLAERRTGKMKETGEGHIELGKKESGERRQSPEPGPARAKKPKLVPKKPKLFAQFLPIFDSWLPHLISSPAAGHTMQGPLRRRLDPLYQGYREGSRIRFPQTGRAKCSPVFLPISLFLFKRALE